MPSPPSRSPSATEIFAGFVADTSFGDLPDAVRHQTKRSLVNYLGCAIGAAEDAAVSAAVKVLGVFSGPEQASLVGRTEKLDALNAAYVNAIAGNLFDFDDTHLATVIHPTAPVAPVVLALAERTGASGKDALLALALGMEVECRIGNSVSPAHYARGWHITATCGVFGAAAAAAKLLHLSSEETANALGIAASESAGLVENLTTAAKNVGVGNAARNGLLAALMAEGGYMAAPTAIEGPLGWARASGDVPDMKRMLGGLGLEWELLANTFKPYPSGIVFHAVIDACLQLRAAHQLDPQAIESVTVIGDSLLLSRGDRAVSSARDARVSTQHCAAVALLFGAAGLREFSSDVAMNPRVVEFRSRVQARLGPEMPKGAARVEILMRDGRRLGTTVMHARGSAELPLSDADIAAKVRDLARHTRAYRQIDQLIEDIWRLEDKADVRGLAAHFSAPPQ